MLIEFKILECNTNKGINRISIFYDDETMEANKIIWYRTDFDHNCLAIKNISDYYNLDNTQMNIIDENTYQFELPTGLILSYDKNGDIDLTIVGDYLRGR